MTTLSRDSIMKMKNQTIGDEMTHITDKSLMSRAYKELKFNNIKKEKKCIWKKNGKKALLDMSQKRLSTL